MTTAPSTSRRATGRPWIRWAIGLGAVAVIAVAVFAAWPGRSSAALAVNTSPVMRGNIVASVSGSGSIDAAQALDLAFQSNGTVTAVLVQAGDVVTAGQPLARLDDHVLVAQLANAQSNLASAQAQLDDLNAAPSAAELASAQLSVANAHVQLEKLTPSAADIAGARSSLTSAQLKLADVQNGTDVQKARDALEQAKNSLWSQQVSRDATCGNPMMQTQCDQANAAVGNAEVQVRQAQTTLDNLLANGQSNLGVAQLNVQQARARLADLLAPATAAEIEAANLQLTVAQAKLDELKAGPAAADLARAEASVASAELALVQAQTAFDNTTLRAPFAGTITAINVTAGGSSTGVAVSIIDRSHLHVDLKLSENDAVRVQIGRPVTLTVKSMDGKTFSGKVGYVAPAAQTSNGVVTYAVRVDFDTAQGDVKVGMTANLKIVVAQKENVLLVPNTALLPKGTGRIVRLVEAGQAARDVDVQVGLSDGTYTEIVSGLVEGQQIVTLPNSATTRTSGFPFGGGQ